MNGVERIFTADALQSYICHPLFFDLALFRIEKIGPISFKRCLQVFGCAENTFKASAEALKNSGLTKVSAEHCKNFFVAYRQGVKSLQNNSIFKGVINDIEWANQPQHFIILSGDNSYPKALKQIYDYPPLLFVIGNIMLLSSPQIAVVGSRRPSRLGSKDAQEFSKALSEKGLTITSGLATGIDTFAHLGAIESNSPLTIAVLAHGLDGIYPKSNQALAAQIVNAGGALVSEFPIGIKPRPEYFPRRNRIISGLSKGVLVVEAAIKSGTLITAYSALEQNREVFAVPGSIHNPVAKGCHKLIQSGAKLVECCDDILEELDHVLLSETIVDNTHIENNKSLSTKEEILLKALDHEEQTQNELASHLDLPIHEVSATLVYLELKGLVFQGEVGFVKSPSTAKP